MEMLLRAAALGVLLLLAGPMAGWAEESICPNGSNPRSDITWCSDFDNLANCTTGQESQCWTDNHYSTTGGTGPYAETIVGTGGAVGNGYVRCRAEPGSTACSTVVVEPVPGFTNSTAVNFRYYIRYSRGYISFDTGHNIQMEGIGTGGNGVALKFQLSAYSGVVYVAGPAGSYFLQPNQGQSTTLLNNRWYLIEVQGIMDTSCAPPYGAHDCDGQVRVWIDETLVTQYTDVNLGGFQNSMKWGNVFRAPESYYHYGVPPWGFEIAWDNFAVSNNGTHIGPAANENARGTGDPSSPYMNLIPYGALLGRHAKSDCTNSSQASEYFTGQYRSGGAIESGHTHGLFTNGCEMTIAMRNSIYNGPPTAHRTDGMLVTITDGTSSTDCTSAGGGTNRHNCRFVGNPTDGAWTFTEDQDNAMKVNLTNASDGGGHNRERPDSYAWPQWVSSGWIWLPHPCGSAPCNTYTVTNLALSGFTNGVNTPDYGYVAFSVSNGNWSIDQKNDAGAHGSLVSSTPVTYDTWHEYELILWKNGSGTCATANGCVSLMIDRTRIYTTEPLPQSAAWAFQVIPENPVPKPVVGVIDFQGTPPFTAYFDDVVVTTVSAWSCDGWGVASCPFGGGPKIARGVALGRGVKVR